MKLHSLQITGFKSYTSPVTITNFHSFNAITGLNGSGKSNILDAIIFCLHLDNPRKLRVKSLTELINYQCQEASVVCTFVDNEKPIVIKRVLLRNGTSKSSINGLSCTGVTLSKFLMSHNLSKNCSNVVMQGNIAKVLGLLCYRNYLQEMAGIKSYEGEKRNALATIEKKEEKLKMARELLDRRIGPFFQKIRAEKLRYLENKRIMERRAGTEQRVAELEEKILKGKVSFLSNEINEKLLVFSKNKTELASCEVDICDEIDFKQVRAGIAEASTQASIFKERLKGVDAEIAELGNFEINFAELENLKGELDLMREKEKAMNARLVSEEKKKAGLGGSGMGDLMEKLDRNKQNFEVLSSEVHRLSEKMLSKLDFISKNALLGELVLTESGAVAIKTKNGNKKMSEVFYSLRNESGKDAVSLEELKNFEMQFKKINDFEKLLVLKAESKSELLFEADALRAKLPYPIMDGVYGTAGELYTLKDAKYAEAVAVALGGRRNYILVENEKIGGQLIKQSNRHVNVIPLNRIKSTLIKRNALCALNVIDFDARYKSAFEYLLGNIYIFDDKREASEFCYSTKTMAVSVDGNAYDPRGIITGGSTREYAQATRKDLDLVLKKIEECEAAGNFYKKYKPEFEQITESKRLAVHLMTKSREMERASEWLKTHEQVVFCGNIKAELQKTQKSRLLMENKISKLDERKSKNEINNDKKRQLNTNKSEIVAEIDLANKKLEELNRELVALEKLASERQIVMAERKIKEEKRKTLLAENGRLKTLIKKNGKKLRELMDHRAFKKRRKGGKENIENQESFVEKENSSEGEQNFLQAEENEEFSEINEFLRIIKKMKLPKLDEREYNAMSDELVSLNAELNNKENTKMFMDPKNFDLLERNEETLKVLEQKIEKLTIDKTKIIKSIEDLSSLGLTELTKAKAHVNTVTSAYLKYFIANSQLKITENYELEVFIGNENRTSELSGGQRSVVALCLVFAMITYKPAPFYIFDEIDSALDLSYTQSIGELLKKEVKAQFFVVSLKEDMFRYADCVFEVGCEDNKPVVKKIVSQ